PSTGTYTLLVDPDQTDTGSITVTLYNVPADASTTIAPPGAAVAIGTTVPGQNAKLTFAGTTGQRISLKTTGITFPDGDAYVSIPRPVVTMLFPPGWTADVPYTTPFRPPSTGTYTLLVDPDQTDTGSITVTLYNVP